MSNYQRDPQEVFSDLRRMLGGTEEETVATTFVVDAEGDTSATETITDWRNAETPTEPVTSEPQLPPPAPGASPYAYGAPTSGPTPGRASGPIPGPVPTAPPTVKPPIRVGLLIWSGILIILAIITLASFIGLSVNGFVLLVILLSIFGLVLIGTGLGFSSRQNRNR